MTKNVLLQMKGFQLMGDEHPEAVEVAVPGVYFEKDGTHYIKYEETMEGFDGTVNNLIKIKESSMEVTKRGVTNAHMVFERNKKHMTDYGTPFGILQMGVAATKIALHTEEDALDVKVEYTLEVNQEHLADCAICIHVTAGDNEQA